MKYISFLPLSLFLLLIVSCGQSSTSADKPSDKKGNIAAPEESPAPAGDENTTAPAGENPVPENSKSETIPPKKNTGNNSKDPVTVQSGQTRGMDSDPDAGDILANIDRYLVSSQQFTPSAGGGFTNGIIKLNNTLPDAGFQKAFLEVNILKEDGSLAKTDYYTVINIEPGGMKVVKLPDSKLGSKLSTRVIKVKSNELTKGEYVLAGNSLSANQ